VRRACRGLIRDSGFGIRVSGVTSPRPAQAHPRLGALLRFQVPDPKSRVSGFKLGVSGFGFRVSGFGFRDSSFGFRVSGFKLRVSGFKLRVSGFGIQASGFGIRDSSFGFRGSGFKFRVSGFGSWGLPRPGASWPRRSPPSAAAAPRSAAPWF